MKVNVDMLISIGIAGGSGPPSPSSALMQDGLCGTADPQKVFTRNRIINSEPHEPQNDFFCNCADYIRLEPQIQQMAVAMIDTNINALRKNCEMRALKTDGSRRELIIRVCQSHQNRQ